jgi:hypothetical protein
MTDWAYDLLALEDRKQDLDDNLMEQEVRMIIM